MSIPYDCGCETDEDSDYPRLNPGDYVGIITPSYSAISEGWDVAVLAEKIRKDYEVFGLKVKYAKNWASIRALPYGGTPRERLDDLIEMYEDPQVKLIVASHGGYDSIELTNKIKYSILRQNPKLLVGSGDIGILQMAIQKEAGLKAIHGPVGTDVWDEVMKRTFCCMLMKAKKITYRNPQSKTIISGRAQGTLIGGEIDAILTTGWTDQFYTIKSGYILFIYATILIDYDFEQLIHVLDQGKVFERAGGLIFGYCATCTSDVENINKMVSDVWRKYPDTPSFVQANITSDPGSHILPIDTLVEIDADKKEIKMLEPIVK